MPRSTVTRVWLIEWAHLDQFVVHWHLTTFFFVVSWVLFDKTVTWVQSVTQGRSTWYSGRSSMLSSDSWKIDIHGLCTADHSTLQALQHFHDSTGNSLVIGLHDSEVHQFVSSATSKTGNRFGWSFFFAVWRRCARSRLHMSSVVLAESQGESCALFRIVRLQIFDRRDMLFTVHLSRLTRTHHWSSPRSKLAYKKPTSTRKLRKFPVTSGQGSNFKSKHRDWTASRWWARWRSQSSSCQHHVITWHELILADHEYLDSVAWPCMIARWHQCGTMMSQMLARASLSAVVWPSSRSNFDLGPSPSDSTEKNLSYQSLWFWSAVFL